MQHVSRQLKEENKNQRRGRSCDILGTIHIIIWLRLLLNSKFGCMCGQGLTQDNSVSESKILWHTQKFLHSHSIDISEAESERTEHLRITLNILFSPWKLHLLNVEKHEKEQFCLAGYIKKKKGGGGNNPLSIASAQVPTVRSCTETAELLYYTGK
uniref:Uncharacterized protein n=1 Tax=Sphaerodactylus townsendi TaxID=933632 RepID=A0ACB8FCD9_9SAUR